MKEKELFEALKKLIPDLERTKDHFDSIDAYSEKHQLKIEVKCRNKHYPHLIIEKKKWEELNKYPKARYICSTPEGVYSFNIKENEPVWFSRRMPNASNQFYSGYISKEIGYLYLWQAKDITNKIYGKTY